MKEVRQTSIARAAAMSIILMVVGCGATTAALPDPTQIVVQDFMFQPNTITVKAGATVTWSNKDDEPHTVKSDTGLFKSGAMDTNETFSFKFDQPGTYHFTCSIHPRMTGTIVVQ